MRTLVFVAAVSCTGSHGSQMTIDSGIAECIPQPQIAPCYVSPPLPDGGVFGTQGQYAFTTDSPTTTTQFAIYSTATHTSFEFINLLVGWAGSYDTTLQAGNYWALDVEPVVNHVAGSYPLSAQGIHLSMRLTNPKPGDNVVALHIEPNGGIIYAPDGYISGNARIYQGLDLRGYNGAHLTGAICQATSCSDSLGNVQAIASTMVIGFDIPFNNDNDAVCFVQGLDGAAVPPIHQTALALTVTAVVGAHYHYFCPGRYK